MKSNSIFSSFFFLLLSSCASLLSPTKQVAPLVPQSVNDGWMKSYTSEEKDRIEEDLNHIRSTTFRHKVGHHQNPRYIATAGGLGSSKSTIFETILKDPAYKDYVYLDPDQRTLRFMHTYLDSVNLYEVSQKKSFKEVVELAYNKWRGGSNYIWNTLVNEAFANKFHIALGATSSSPFMESHYKSLKEQGYSIELVLCGSTDANRVAAIKARGEEQGFVQSTEQDIVEKVIMFYQRMPIYFKYADVIHIYWTSSFREAGVKAAIYKDQKMTVLDQKSFDAFVAQVSEEFREPLLRYLPKKP